MVLEKLDKRGGQGVICEGARVVEIPIRQASILDTVFEGSVVPLENGMVIPRVSGSAWVNGESTLLLDPEDPFRWGVGRGGAAGSG